jgi:hypothetical protein
VKTRYLITMLAALAIVAGGFYGIQQSNAGSGCSAQAEKADATKASAGTDAKVTTATATNTGAACCAAGKASAQKASGATCTYAEGIKACATDGKGSNTTAQLMSADAALAKLAHCGIDPRSVDAEKLSAMLADKGCGGYSAEQWATMLKSVKALDAKEANAVYAKATSESPCASDDCPMTLVAKELAAGDKAPKNN